MCISFLINIVYANLFLLSFDWFHLVSFVSCLSDFCSVSGTDWFFVVVVTIVVVVLMELSYNKNFNFIQIISPSHTKISKCVKKKSERFKWFCSSFNCFLFLFFFLSFLAKSRLQSVLYLLSAAISSTSSGLHKYFFIIFLSFLKWLLLSASALNVFFSPPSLTLLIG